jgi:hypothetical protein
MGRTLAGKGPPVNNLISTGNDLTAQDRSIIIIPVSFPILRLNKITNSGIIHKLTGHVVNVWHVIEFHF